MYVVSQERATYNLKNLHMKLIRFKLSQFSMPRKIYHNNQRQQHMRIMKPTFENNVWRTWFVLEQCEKDTSDLQDFYKAVSKLEKIVLCKKYLNHCPWAHKIFTLFQWIE